MSETISTPPPPGAPSAHSVAAAVRVIQAALADVSEVEPTFMVATDKATALIDLSRVVDQVRELQLRVMASADDVAEAAGSRDAAAWLAHQARLEPGECRRLQRLAGQLDGRHAPVRVALRDGRANLAQAEVITRAVDALPSEVDAELRVRVMEHLVDQAQHFGPRALRILGRRVLAVIAPELGEEHERRRLEEEEREARRRTFLRTRRNGDGTTDIHARVSDAIAARLLAYLQSFTSPRRDHLTPDDGEPGGDGASATAGESDPGTTASRSHGSGAGPDDRRPYDQRMGHAFGAFLETVDPARLPVHGGDATTVMITIDYAAICEQLGFGLLGDEPMTAGEVRRLACNAKLIPAVLGGRSEILDLGRTARLASPVQRRALAVRDVTCRGEGCDIPAAWSEAHHVDPWALGGSTDLSDLVLLCSFHHHRAHDHRYRHERQSDGRLRFYRHA